MYPRYILLDNGTEFKNQLMIKYSNNVALITSSLHYITLRAMGYWEVFHKYLKPTLKKCCEKDMTSWHKYINQLLASY